MTTLAPVTDASPLARRNFAGWFVFERNKKRRRAARVANGGEVITQWCSGTTLVEVLLTGVGSGTTTRETPNSPTCGGPPADRLVTEDGDQVLAENGNSIILE